MHLDPENTIVQARFAVIYTPSQRRKRFPENCVTPVASAEQAIEQAAGQSDCHAARVVGPSRSSEGFRLYYLLEWLNGD